MKYVFTFVLCVLASAFLITLTTLLPEPASAVESSGFFHSFGIMIGKILFLFCYMGGLLLVVIAPFSGMLLPKKKSSYQESKKRMTALGYGAGKKFAKRLDMEA